MHATHIQTSLAQSLSIACRETTLRDMFSTSRMAMSLTLVMVCTSIADAKPRTQLTLAKRYKAEKAQRHPAKGALATCPSDNKSSPNLDPNRNACVWVLLTHDLEKLVPERKALIAFAREVFADGITPWEQIELTVADRRRLPRAKGARTPDFSYVAVNADFALPFTDQRGYLDNTMLSAKPAKKTVDMTTTLLGELEACRRAPKGRVYAWRPATKQSAKNERIRALFVVRCKSYKTDFGISVDQTWQSYVYDENGRLGLVFQEQEGFLYRWSNGKRPRLEQVDAVFIGPFNRTNREFKAK